MSRPGSPSIRLGAVGAGMVFAHYERAVESLPGVGIVAVADPCPRRRRRAARPGRRIHASCRELLAEPLDAVLVLTPNAGHAAVVEACLERGLDTLCEKPLATDAATAEALLALAARRGAVLFAAMHCRYRPEVRYLFDHLPGRVVRFELVYREDWSRGPSWYFDPAVSGGGVLLDVGINQLDWLQSRVGPLRPESARARLGATGVELEFEAEWSFPGGRGSSALSWRGDPETKVTRLETDAGAILELDHSDHRVVHDGRPLGPWRNDEYAGVLRDFLSARADPAARPAANAPEMLHLLRAAYALAELPFLRRPDAGAESR